MDIIQKIIKERNEDIQKRYKKLIKGKTKEEKRKIELELFKPEKLKEVNIKPTAKTDVQRKSITLFFQTIEEAELFKKYFKTFEYCGQTTTDTGAILALLRGFEKGTIRYDKKRNKLRFKVRKTE